MMAGFSRSRKPINLACLRLYNVHHTREEMLRKKKFFPKCAGKNICHLAGHENTFWYRKSPIGLDGIGIGCHFLQPEIGGPPAVPHRTIHGIMQGGDNFWLKKRRTIHGILQGVDNFWL
jgi:hypothetical protein